MRKLLLLALLPIVGCAHPDPNAWDPHSAMYPRQPVYIAPAPYMIPPPPQMKTVPLPVQTNCQRFGNQLQCTSY